MALSRWANTSTLWRNAPQHFFKHNQGYHTRKLFWSQNTWRFFFTRGSKQFMGKNVFFSKTRFFAFFGAHSAIFFLGFFFHFSLWNIIWFFLNLRKMNVWGAAPQYFWGTATLWGGFGTFAHHGHYSTTWIHKSISYVVLFEFFED